MNINIKDDKIFDNSYWNYVKNDVMLEIGKVLKSFKENDVNDFIQKIVEIKKISVNLIIKRFK